MISLVFDARTKDMVVSEVEQQGDFALQMISTSIRNATAINSPTPGTSASSLSIETLIPTNNPTVFSLLNGVIIIKEGSASAVELTNSRVKVNSLNFQNLSQTLANDNIRTSFAISYHSSSTQQVYNYSRNFYNSASLRQ